MVSWTGLYEERQFRTPTENPLGPDSTHWNRSVYGVRLGTERVMILFFCPNYQKTRVPLHQKSTKNSFPDPLPTRLYVLGRSTVVPRLSVVKTSRVPLKGGEFLRTLVHQDTPLLRVVDLTVPFYINGKQRFMFPSQISVLWACPYRNEDPRTDPSVRRTNTTERDPSPP